MYCYMSLKKPFRIEQFVIRDSEDTIIVDYGTTNFKIFDAVGPQKYRRYTKMQLKQTLHYCKADKKTGKPLIVTDMRNNKRRNTAHWKRVLYTKSGKKVILKCDFKNSTGKAKAQGATSVLQIFE